MTFKVKSDPDVDAAYFQIDNGNVLESEEIAEGIIVDYDLNNKIIGVELLGLKTLNRQGFYVLEPLLSPNVKDQFKEYFTKSALV